MRLKGKKILVTAAGQGIGRASVLALHAEGAEVIATDIKLELMADLPVAQKVALDVTNGQEILDLAARTSGLDGLFNCAGMVAHGSLLDLTDEDWQRSLDLNITSMVRMNRAFLPQMLKQAEKTGGASIVNMSSMASSVKGFVNRAAYGATKAAVIGLTKSIAADFVKQGIRCNALCPGTVDTPSLRGRIASAADPVQAEKDFIARQPMGRLARAEDISPMVVYLMSDESLFVSGQAISVDGGVTI